MMTTRRRDTMRALSHVEQVGVWDAAMAREIRHSTSNFSLLSLNTASDEKADIVPDVS